MAAPYDSPAIAREQVACCCCGRPMNASNVIGFDRHPHDGVCMARPACGSEPAQLTASGHRPRAFTVLDRACELLRIRGFRRALRVARLVPRAAVLTARRQEDRRWFLRSGGGLLVTLLGSSMLAACGASATSSASSPASVSTPSVTGEFVARDLTAHTWVALSTDGRKVTAYACDGDHEHPITFAQWFTGSVTDNAADLTNANGAHLMATLTSKAVTGTVALPDGKSFSFTANAITSSRAGLYRSEQTIGGVTYVAGWVVPDSAVAAKPTGVLLVGGGILRPRGGELLTAPALTSQDISTGQVLVSGLGMFVLTQCHLGTCS